MSHCSDIESLANRVKQSLHVDERAYFEMRMTKIQQSQSDDEGIKKEKTKKQYCTFRVLYTRNQPLNLQIKKQRALRSQCSDRSLKIKKRSIAKKKVVKNK
ncbi:hypothetical protein pb186bvf_010387 [Paramecium bursaria]